MIESLKKNLAFLDNLYGVSGDESEVASGLKEAMAGLYDECFTDNLGIIYFAKHGKKHGTSEQKTLVICSHMDEIGFMVREIEENGMVRIVPVGYHDDRVCINQRLKIVTDSGDKISAVTGSIPFHALDHEEQQKGIAIGDLVVDCGTSSKDETLALGVQLGDYVAFEAKGEFLNGGKFYTGKSVDDRSGCAVLVETLKALKNVEIDATIYVVGSVQEEVGMRSGGPMANRLQPDLLLAIDVALSKGIPGMESHASLEMGKGPAIMYYDWDGALGMTGNNVPRHLTKMLIQTAERANIPYQREVCTGGGTDAWSASLAGTGYLCGGLCIPSQYIHTAVGTVHIDDLVALTQLIVAVAKEF